MRLLLLLDLAVLGLIVYALIDCIQTDSVQARNLSKPMWILLIVVVPLVGAISWLVAGRPEPAATRARGAVRPSGRAGATAYRRPTPPLGPDDDPEFLRQIRSIDAEHQRTLEQWERDLRDRERRLREGKPPADGTPPGNGAPPTDGSPPGPAPSGGPR